jgi:hypothetical protein
VRGVAVCFLDRCCERTVAISSTDLEVLPHFPTEPVRVADIDPSKMFLRSATRRELLALSRAMEITFPVNLTPAAKKGTPEAIAGQKQYKLLVVAALRKEMLDRGLPIVLEALKNPESRESIAAEMRSDLATVTAEDELLERAKELNLNIFSVAEKDFLQLAHGTHGKLIAGHKGIECILGGILLALCYQKLPRDKTMVGFVTRVLMQMLPVDVWSNALKMYGPARKMETEMKYRRSHTVVRSVCCLNCLWN